MLVTGAESSRIKKKRRGVSSTLQRSSPSPFSSTARRKPISKSKRQSKPFENENDDPSFHTPLDDTGELASLATDLTLRDVAQFVKNINRRMFDEIPDRASGISSTRVAEILNYRKDLPPLVTLSHVHAISRSITQADREIAELSHAAIVRKLTIPWRGSGTSNVGEGLVLVSEWEKRVRLSTELSTPVKDKYVALLRDRVASKAVPGSAFSPMEFALLTSAGFLTSSSQARATLVDTYSRPSAGAFSTLTSLSSIGSKAASGTLDAIGGTGAFVSTGASAGGAVQKQSATIPGSAQYNLTLPNIGPLLKLIVDARAHLLSLLSKVSKYNEAPLSVLQERWDGGLANSDALSKTKKSRGEPVGALPGKTKKWKTFNGLRFEWILEECVGAGLIECFETRSVGTAARLLR